MGDVKTLTIPAEHVQTLRLAVYGELAGAGNTLDGCASALGFPNGRSWDELDCDDPVKAECCAVDVLKASRAVAALVAVMDQLGWTDPIDGPVELEADCELLASLIEGGLVDSGDALDNITDNRPFDRPAFDRATERAIWFADRRDELSGAVA